MSEDPKTTGTRNFRQMHWTSLAGIPLTAIFIYIAARFLGAPFAQAKAAFANPFIAGAMALFVPVSVHHMRIGMQSIILDYVHGKKLKPALLTANNIFCGLVAFIALLALLRLNLKA
jgi:succinate dehydrogenase / fumarate reductase membrane anchor subunit